MAEWIGRTIAKVEIQKRLGRGGMAEVYLGTHTTLGRPVAVKVLLSHLSDDPELLTRFEHEARAVAALRHPNIVQVFDFDVADDRPYMVMEYVDGYGLADVLRNLATADQLLPVETTARLITALAAALDSAHARCIVHRDVKPANVLLRRDSGFFTPDGPLPPDVEPVLTDFGVMHMIGGNRQTVTGRVYGTPAYMSPEQVRGDDVDGRSDIYALGVLLYEMLTGRPPFDARFDTPSSVLIKHLNTPPPPAVGVGPAVQAVLDRALAKSPDERYQKASDLAADLKHALGEAGNATIPHLRQVELPAPPAGRDEWPGTPAAGVPGRMYLELLHKGDIFAGLDETFLAQIAAVLVEQQIPAGTMVFHRGDPGDVLYIVRSGRIKIFTRAGDGTEKVLGFDTEGSFFGEMALLTGEPRSASAEAVSDSRLLLLAKDDFDRLLADNPIVQRTMLAVIARRQAALTRLLTEHQTGAAPAGAGQPGQVFTLFSPKGGAGTSTLAVNLAVALAHRHPNEVLLLDLNLTFGHTALLLNLVPRTSLATINVANLKSLAQDCLTDYLIPHASTLRLLAGALRFEDRNLVTRTHVETTLDLLRRCFRYIVVDTAAMLSDPVLAAVEAADRLVLITTPDRTALRDTRECGRFFADGIGVPADRFFYLLNRPAGHAGISHDQFEAILKHPFQAELPFGAGLPAKAASRGEAFVVMQPEAPLAVAVERLADSLTGAESGAHQPAWNKRSVSSGRAV